MVFMIEAAPNFNKIDRVAVGVASHANLKEYITDDNMPVNPFAVSGVWEAAFSDEIPYYGEHMRAGVAAREETGDKGVLVPSGGFTRNEQWSEAASYRKAAEVIGLLVPGMAGVTLDEDALDSLGNVAGAARAYEGATRELPQHLIVVGWKFKEERFKYHAKTLGIPKKKFTYVGVNNPDGKALAGALIGEEKELAAFRADPFGERDYLRAKRNSRNITGRKTPSYGKGEKFIA